MKWSSSTQWQIESNLILLKVAQSRKIRIKINISLATESGNRMHHVESQLLAKECKSLCANLARYYDRQSQILCSFHLDLCRCSLNI